MKYVMLVILGVMLGITLVDMSVGSESTIRSFLWDLF